MNKRHHGRNKLLASVIAATLASTAGMPTISWAQSADATLRGRAVANGTVTAKNIATGATRRTTADAEGIYAMVGLPPGTYQVDAGPGTAQTVTLSVASTATLDLQPEAASATAANNLEAITVHATALTEVKTSEIGSTISLHEIETIPQITRNFLEFADTVPGMVFSVDKSGNTSLRGGAQSNNSVNVFIDGVGQKNYVKEGGVSGQFFSQGNPFPQLAIGEYKVITSNYKAEYDQISSAAVTAGTKSGTNEFVGEAFDTFTNDGYRSATPSERAAGRKTTSDSKEYGVALGGPIIKDVLHFFVNYEGKKFDTPVAVTPGVSGTEAFLPAAVAAQFGPAGLPFKEDLYFGKLDWEPTDRDRFVVSTKIRREANRLNVGVAQAVSASIDVINNDKRVDARWQRSADRWFNEVLVTYEDAANAPTARGLGNGSVYTFQPKQDATIIDVGPASPLATQNKRQSGTGFQDDLTFSGLHWMGDHTMKMGAKYKLVKLTAQDALNINPQFFYDVNPNPAGTAALPYKAFFTTAVPGLNPTAESKNKQFGVYFQDDWVVNRRLTLNLGIRWDYEDTPSYLNYMTPANVVAALTGQDPNGPPGQTYAQSLAKGGVNVNDYISNGHNRSALKNEWQPRVGFSFDINEDQQHVVFGGAGRAYDRNLYDYLQLEQTKAALPAFNIFFNQPERPCNASPTCVAWDPKYLNGLANLQSLVSASNTGKEVDMINNRLKAPYSDTYSLGMRNKVADWHTSASVVRTVSHDGFAFTLGNRFPDGAFWMNGGQPWGNGVPGFGPLIIGSNGIETRTTELLLSADKPFTRESGWGATFAYTFTDAKHNRDINEHYSFDEATIQQYPFILSNAAAKHRFVATGTIQGPWRMMYAAKLTLATPIPKNDLACIGIRYSTGSNCTPIAGTPNRQASGLGGNSLGYRSVDLQATKDIDIAGSASVYLRLDVLNLFNFENYADYQTNWGGNGIPNPNPVRYDTNGNIVGVPRTVKVTIGVRF